MFVLGFAGELPRHIKRISFVQHIACAVHLGGENVFRFVQRQRGRRVDDDINAFQSGLDRSAVADVAGDDSDLAANVLIVKRSNVERSDMLPFR